MFFGMENSALRVERLCPITLTTIKMSSGQLEFRQHTKKGTTTKVDLWFKWVSYAVDPSIYAQA